MAATSPTTVSLQGWDTANVTSFDVINAAIAKQGKTPPSFAIISGDPLSSPSATGAWDTWLLVPGGAGQTLQMQCPIKSGVAIFATSTNTGLTLDKATAGSALTFDITSLVVSSPAGPATAPPQSVLGSVGRNSGRYYFEVTLGSSASTAVVGIAPAGAAGQAFASTTAGAYGYRSDGQAMSAGAAVAFPGGAALPWKQGDTVGFAVDIDAGKIWFRGPDGNWQGGAGADPTAGTSPAFSFTPNTTIYAAIAVGAGDTATANFLEMAAKFPPPAGYAPFVASFATAKLDGGSLNVQIALAQTPLPPSKTMLMADPTSTPASPAVVVMSFNAPAGSALTRAQLNQILAVFDYELNKDIANFKNIFHTFDVNSALAANKNLAWLNPTANEYAVADAASPATATSAFALLSMTENRDDSMLSAQIDPSILGGLPTGTNSVFAISAERFAQNVLLGVAQALAVGSTASDFSLDATTLDITNNGDIPWREITLDDGSKVTPTIPAGGMHLRVDGDHIEIEYSGLYFNMPQWKFPGHQVATLGFSQNIYLTLAARTDGKHVLVARNVDPNSGNAAAIAADLPILINPKLTISLDPQAITFQDAMEYITIGLSVLSIGLISFSAGAWIIRNAKIAQTAAAAANSGDGGVALGEVNPAANQSEYQNVAAARAAAGAAGYDAANLPIQGFESDAVASVAAEANAGGAAGGGAVAAGVVKAGGVMFVTKAAIGFTVGAVLSAVGAASVGAVYGISTSEALAGGDVNNVPLDFTIEKIIADYLAPYDWSGTANNWTPVDVRLAESLVIYGALN